MVSEKFKKRELVVTTPDEYPQDLLIQFTQDRVDLLNDLKEGDNVCVNINLRGREWTSPKGEVKYFNTIEGWKVEVKAGNEAAGAVQVDGDLNNLPF